MTTAANDIEGASNSTEAVSEAFKAIRADKAIQYENPAMEVLPPPPPPAKPPAWLEALIRFLEDLLSPLGELLGGGWSVIEMLLLIGGAILILAILWGIFGPMAGLRRNKKADEEDELQDWTPDRDQALALLDDADRLAAEGRYGEAAHLLLQRSVGHIADARPELLHPSSTSREITRFEGISDRARTAFGVIAGHVERSLFAMRALTQDDWLQSRSAYSDFALADLGSSPGWNG